jgi:hypothetical protein
MLRFLSHLQKQQPMVRIGQHIEKEKDQNYPIESYVSNEKLK